MDQYLSEVGGGIVYIGGWVGKCIYSGRTLF